MKKVATWISICTSVLLLMLTVHLFIASRQLNRHRFWILETRGGRMIAIEVDLATANKFSNEGTTVFTVWQNQIVSIENAEVEESSGDWH